jgi:2,6-dihydroxypseudooxynicotine hydrolase
VFLARGLATLAFDGPGQGEAEYDLPILPEYERPVAAVIDWIERRDDLDAARVGLWGVSLGGYYAPRAAAFEPRVKAVVALTGPFDFAEAFRRAPPLTREAFTARSFSASEEEALARPGRAARARRAAGRRRLGAGHADDGRGRDPRRQQPPLQVSPPDRRLARPRAVRRDLKGPGP